MPLDLIYAPLIHLQYSALHTHVAIDQFIQMTFPKSPYQRQKSINLTTQSTVAATNNNTSNLYIKQLITWMLRPSVRNIVSLSSFRFCTEARLMPAVWQRTAFSASRSTTDVMSRALLISAYWTTENTLHTTHTRHLTVYKLRQLAADYNMNFNFTVLSKLEILLQEIQFDDVWKVWTKYRAILCLHRVTVSHGRQASSSRRCNKALCLSLLCLIKFTSLFCVTVAVIYICSWADVSLLAAAMLLWWWDFITMHSCSLRYFVSIGYCSPVSLQLSTNSIKVVLSTVYQIQQCWMTCHDTMTQSSQVLNHMITYLIPNKTNHHKLENCMKTLCTDKTLSRLNYIVSILTGYTQVQRHLSLMSLSNEPFCSYCKEAVESASHFLRNCNYFAVLRTTV